MKTRMTPKQYLNQAYHLNELIESDIEELRTLRATIDGLSAVNYGREHVQGGSVKSSPAENIVMKIMAQEDRINEEIDRFVDLKAEIRAEIEKLPNLTEQLVLRLRYIQFKSWPQIQEILGTRERRAYDIHSAALSHFRVPEVSARK